MVYNVFTENIFEYLEKHNFFHDEMANKLFLFIYSTFWWTIVQNIVLS